MGGKFHNYTKMGTECDICGGKVTKKQMGWEEKQNIVPCYCKEWRRNKELKKVRKLNSEMANFIMGCDLWGAFENWSKEDSD